MARRFHLTKTNVHQVRLTDGKFCVMIRKILQTVDAGKCRLCLYRESGVLKSRQETDRPMGRGGCSEPSLTKYTATRGHASVAWDLLGSCKEHGGSRECKVAPRISIYSSLTEFLSGIFYLEEML